MTLEGFYAPFAEKLSTDNRWVKLSDKMPWDIIEAEYLKNIQPEKGRPSISSGIAFGACFIRNAENITDERTVLAIAENPYMQYFLGLKEFDPEPLFDPSMMVHFRKRFPVNFVSKVNEYLCTGKWPEGSRNVDRNDDNNDSDDKRPNPTEFGQKTHLSVVNGYVYLEQTSWSNFNESTDLIPCAEDYKRKFGFYPKAILADKIYQTKANKKYCKERGIRLSGRSLGRKNQEQKEAETEQMYRDSCQRNWVEGKNGLLKTRYGMSRVMCKLDESAKSDLVFAILAMNAFRKLREDILRLFREIGFSLVVCCVILCCETA